MILVILGISIAVVIAGIIIYEKTSLDDLPSAMQIIGFVAAAVAIVTAIIPVIPVITYGATRANAAKPTANTAIRAKNANISPK